MLLVLTSLLALPPAHANTAGLRSSASHGGSTRLRVEGGGDATIRNGPPAIGSGYVIGNALAARPGGTGVTFDLTGTEIRGFRYGRIHGNVEVCGWLSVNAQTKVEGTVPSARCPGGPAGRTLSPSRFMQALPGGKLLRNCEPGTCHTGSSTRVVPALCAQQYPGGVPVYGNVLPWRVPAAPHDQYGTIRAKSYFVLWRYASRDGGWVMVHDSHERAGAARRNAGIDAQASDWFFVPRRCVEATHQR